MMFTALPNIVYNVSKHKTIDVYKSPKKKFTMITKVTERNNNLMIQREITWYDNKKQKYMKKKEIQHYDCEDTSCEELENKNMLFDCADMNEITNDTCNFVDYD
jgi:hypothetical protein